MSAARNPDLERRLLEVIECRATRRLGLDATGYAARVRHRLSLGEQRFGDRFLRRDNIAEGREEAQDLGSYALLEIRRLEHDGRLTDAIRDDLLRAAVLAAAADAYLRRAASALRREQRRGGRE